MRLGMVVVLVLVGLVGVTAAPEESPVDLVETADACELTQCVPHEPICWGPHERPTCI